MNFELLLKQPPESLYKCSINTQQLEKMHLSSCWVLCDLLTWRTCCKMRLTAASWSLHYCIRMTSYVKGYSEYFPSTQISVAESVTWRRHSRPARRPATNPIYRNHIDTHAMVESIWVFTIWTFSLLVCCLVPLSIIFGDVNKTLHLVRTHFKPSLSLECGWWGLCVFKFFSAAAHILLFIYIYIYSKINHSFPHADCSAGVLRCQA